jgi:hypothetical protein
MQTISHRHMPSSADLCRGGRFSVSNPATLLLRCLRSQRLENLRLRLQPILIRVAAVGRPDVVRALTNTKRHSLIHGTTSFILDVRQMIHDG